MVKVYISYRKKGRIDEGSTISYRKKKRTDEGNLNWALKNGGLSGDCWGWGPGACREASWIGQGVALRPVESGKRPWGTDTVGEMGMWETNARMTGWLLFVLKSLFNRHGLYFLSNILEHLQTGVIGGLSKRFDNMIKEWNLLLDS